MHRIINRRLASWFLWTHVYETCAYSIFWLKMKVKTCIDFGIKYSNFSWADNNNVFVDILNLLPKRMECFWGDIWPVHMLLTSWNILFDNDKGLNIILFRTMSAHTRRDGMKRGLEYVSIECRAIYSLLRCYGLNRDLRKAWTYAYMHIEVLGKRWGGPSQSIKFV